MKFCMHCMSPIEETDTECPFCGNSIEYEVPAHHLKPGTVLNKKFVVGAALGEGGFGITYIGRDTKLDMKVAIKEYYPNGYVNRSNTLSSDVNCGTTGDRKDFFDKGRERFLREARILAKFSGEPGVVDVRDFFEENNTAYIVMEYLDGEDLKEYLSHKGTLTPEQTIRMLMPLMQALTKIHEQGLIHRDISPDNIRLVNQGVKLMDFGAARDVSAVANKSLSVMLKPGYAPEEQYRSKGEQGPWTDVYALCATIYKCITGITPDDSTQRVFSDELKTPSALGIPMDTVLEEALMKGLAVLQKDRYQSIPELINGFKGINNMASSDGKTVYAGKPVSEDDVSTRYMGNDDVTHSNVEVETKEEDTPVYKGNNEKIDEKDEPKKNPIIKEDKKATPVVDKSTEKKPRKTRKRFGVIALACVIGIVAIVAISTLFSALNKTTIGDEKVNKNEDRLSLYEENITVDDMKNIISMGKLESLTFSSCTFDSAAAEYIGDISSKLTSLSFDSCQGINSFKEISNLKFLNYLTIKDCGLTNEMLKEIDFTNKDYLMHVDLGKNNELSDISKLSEISETLTELEISRTAVKDFSSLKDCKVLTRIVANGNGIETLDSIKNNTITDLEVKENAITDIKAVANFEYLRYFYGSKNKITDISALKDHQALYHVELNENQITDISALSNCPMLGELQISDNQITSLDPLAECTQLKFLYANRNKLTSVDGLEKALELTYIQVAENQITNINGLTNCTILKEVNLNKNQVSDISLLAKSAKTLERVYFNNNKVSDISALKGTALLEYLSFDFNSVTDLDALSNSPNLLAISAEGNQLTSMEGLSSSTQLKYICLPHNKIESMAPIGRLIPRAENDFAVIDLSNNNIKNLVLSSEKSFSYLAVYNNPIESYAQVANSKGNYFLFTYKEGLDYTGFEEAFNFYRVVDCPLDQQINVKKAIYGEQDYISITSGVSYSTAEEADQEIRNVKTQLLTGSTTPEETEN